MSDNDFLNSLFAAETETAVEPPLSGSLEKKQVNPDNFLDGLFETELNAAELKEQVKPKTAKEVLDDRLKSIQIRAEKYSKIEDDYIYGDKTLRGVKKNNEQYDTDKEKLKADRPKIKAKIKGLESSSDKLDEKVQNLESGLVLKAQEEVKAKLSSLPAEQQRILTESGKVQEFVDKLAQNYKDTLNPAAVKLQKFKDGVDKVSTELNTAEQNLETNSELRDGLKDSLRVQNSSVEDKAKEKIATSLAKLKEKSERLKTEYLESPEGRMDIAVELAIKNSDRPNIEEIKALVGEDKFAEVVESIIQFKINERLKSTTSGMYYKGNKYYDMYEANMIQLAKLKNVDVKSNDYVDGEYESFQSDFETAQLMVIEQLTKTLDVIDKIKAETDSKYKALWKIN
jgi:hypothetical protein